MVCGATRGMVFRRVVAEGELLLLIVTPIAIVIDWLLTRYELCTFYLGDYFVASRFTVCVLISWSLLALMIFLGSLFPALRATRIVPAVALKDE